jgi:hypothetical protein
MPVCPLALFPAWFSQDPGNSRKWFQMLVAFLSLVNEGHLQKITKAMIERRGDVLEWVHRLLGVPFAPAFLVQRLRSCERPVDLGNLCQLTDEHGVPCIGVFQELNTREIQHESAKQFKIPVAKEGARLQASLTLQTTDEKEQEMMAAQFGAATSVSSSSIASTASTETVVGVGAKKLASHVATAKTWLTSLFSAPSWPEIVKESSFTKHLSLLALGRHDPSIAGSRTAEDSCNLHLRGL